MKPNMLFIDSYTHREYRSASMARYSMLQRAMHGKRSVLVHLTQRGYQIEDSLELGKIIEVFSFLEVMNYCNDTLTKGVLK